MFAGLPAQVELTTTPFFPQADDQCGPAALATVLGAAGATATPEALRHEIYLPGRQGSLQPEIMGALRSRDLLPYVIAPDAGALLAEVAQGRPVLVLQRQGIGPWPAWHYAVVIGYDAGPETLVLRSGKDRRASLSLRKFLLTWDRAEHWGVVAVRPGELPARPDFSRYMQAAASIEAVGVSKEAAHKAYAAATRAWPLEPLPWLGLGNVAAAAGDWGAAQQDYRRALTLDPQNTAARNNLAESLRILHCPHAALAVIGHARRPAAPGEIAGGAMLDTEKDITADLERAGVPAQDPPECRQFGTSEADH